MPVTYLSANRVLAEAGNNPNWLHIVPLGPVFRGRDGRVFNVDAEALIKEFNARGEHLVIDVDHSSENGSTRAVGWVTALELRSDGIWGFADFVDANTAGDRSLRGASPVFRVRKREDNILDVVTLESVALTNRPNLRLRSRNVMDQTDVIVTAAVDPVVSGLQIELNTTRAELNQMQTDFAALQKEFHAVKVDAAIQDALRLAKITPASESYHRAACSTLEGLAGFREFITQAPAVVSTQATVAPERPVASRQLTEREKDVARNHGLSEKEYLDELLRIEARR